MPALTEDLSELIVDPKQHVRNLPLPAAESLRIYDTTLRDGEQMPGVALSAQQKYTLAKELSNLGCHIVELCFPLVSTAEHELLRMTCEGKLRGEIRDDLEITLMCRATIKDVDYTLDVVRKAGFSERDVTFEIFSSSSNLHLKYKLGNMLMQREGINPERLPEMPLEFFRQANLKMVTEAISYARSCGVDNVEFGGEDASRAPVEQLIELARAGATAGAKRYIFADTTGSLSPEATRFYCSKLSAALPDVERVIHFHDDFGLGAANALVGILNGFTTFATTINGIGERAGNAPLHAIVAALRYLYGLEIPGFRYDRLVYMRRLVEELTGVPVQAKEPIIGRNVFTHESGIHTHGMSIHRAMYETIPCEEVGGRSQIAFGKHSGREALLKVLERRADEIGRVATPEFADLVLKEVKAERGAMIAKVDTRQLVESYYRNLDRLGFAEDEVVELARRMALREKAAAGVLCND